MEESEKLRPLLLAWALRRGLSEADAEDLVHEVLSILTERYQSRETEWRRLSFGIARNLLRMRYRRQRTRPSLQSADLDIEPDAGPGPLAELESREAREHFTSALSQLDPTDVHILRARFIHGESFADIAQTLGISNPAARQRFVRALLRLRESLPDHY